MTPRKKWRYAGHPYLSGQIKAWHLDVAALGLNSPPAWAIISGRPATPVRNGFRPGTAPRGGITCATIHALASTARLTIAQRSLGFLVNQFIRSRRWKTAFA